MKSEAKPFVIDAGAGILKMGHVGSNKPLLSHNVAGLITKFHNKCQKRFPFLD